MNGLEAIRQWPVTTVAAGWTQPDDEATTSGPRNQPFALASVTKSLVALAVLVAVEEGSLRFDQEIGRPGSTLRHVLSHSSGLAPESGPDSEDGPHVLADPGSRRIYSNYGFELLAQALHDASGIDMATYLDEAVCQPLGLTQTALQGSAAHGAQSSLADLLRVGRELLRPTIIADETLAMARTPFLPEIPGVLPGFGRQDPNPWGLGFEVRGNKEPHWTGANNSAQTFGHFGRAGTFLWIDPEADVACVVLTDRNFGAWAAAAWPDLSDSVLAVSTT